MTGNEARKIFIEYFKKHNHSHIKSFSLVPHDDPTLLFVNAGMVQFKRVFTGDEKRDYSRAVTSQKCVRAGGKHNDLENVGYTARHHTFFEMLGNFSFGDYFKEQAIEFGWDLLTNGYGFDKEQLYVSVYKDDDEAYDIWKDRIGVPENKIVRLGKEDNFWSMGDTGPCGPCSEIYIDRGVEFGCDNKDCAVGCDCDRWLELWNLVFMQFEKNEAGNMIPLPKPSIDTGLGLERVISVLQKVPTNFDTDLFIPIMEKVTELSGKDRNQFRQVDIAMKVIADHSRASAFLICDGVLPSNEGRGYVLRRIMRRAIRYGRSIDLVKPFFHETVETVFSIMDQAYPELKNSAAFILNVVKNEEKKFLKTLDTGIKLLETTIGNLKAQNKSTISGDAIFKLYDTFGFPVDIIVDHVKEMNIDLDIDGFNKAMEKQKTKSKSIKKFTGVREVYKSLTSKGIKTDFKGYDRFICEAKILTIVKDDKKIKIAEKGDSIEIVTDSSVFYAESGGQAGDSGIFENDQCIISINDTLKNASGLIIHKGIVQKGKIKQGDTFTLKVDDKKRENTSLNHSATHILHSALRKILGDHVKQSGSLVTDSRLRFDFSHFSSISLKKLIAIENEVNLRIRENHKINTEEMNMKDAVKRGATALFEEKYGNVVRLVTQGNFSCELCGGTHTVRTGNIGIFKILSEIGIASGIRRIEAVTGQAALDYIHNDQELLNSCTNILKTTKEDAVLKIKSLLKENKNLEKQLESIKTKIASKSIENSDNEIKTVNGINVIAKKVEIENPSQLRNLADQFKTKIGSGIILLGAKSGKKVLLICIVTKDLTKDYHAGDIVKQAAKIVGGGGGGRPDMAQAGGTKPENLDKALESIFKTMS